MIRVFITCLLAFVAAAAVSHPSAQILNKEAPVRVGHYHLNVTSVDAHRKFWVDTLGGTAAKFGNQDIVRFGDVVLFLRVQKPSGGTRGTTIDHIGLVVPDVPAMTKKVVAAGYELTVGRETAGAAAPAPQTGASAVYGRFSYLVGPDGVKVELVTAADPNTAPPIAQQHLHLIKPQ